MTRMPDYLTASRGVIAVIIVALGFAGPKALERVVILTLLGWTTDILDGRLARRYNKGATWVGEREFVCDMVMVFAGLCYLVMAGFIPVIPAGIYVAVTAICIAYFRSKSITMSFAFPVVAVPLIVAYFNAPRAAWMYVIWIVLALIFDWRRFKGVVLEFLYNLKVLQKR